MMPATSGRVTFGAFEVDLESGTLRKPTVKSNMSKPIAPLTPVFFPTPEAFRRWLARHGSTASELLVGFYKVASGRPSLTWSESVDEALCFGWIDGVRKRIDDVSYQIRFTPRRPGSNWSAINIAKAEVLISQGRMQPPGLLAFSPRAAQSPSANPREGEASPDFTAQELTLFKRSPAAWQFFNGTPPSYRRAVVRWITSARQPDTRARRLSRLVDSCAAGKRLQG
jgi:uncharacterized protein YdeI (YjbR/CyaY-like superfamily)